jgi:hypothetical protein
MGTPNLQFFRSDIPTTEIGTLSNPIDFGLCVAGVSSYLSYDILLWNDKGGSLNADDVFSIELELLRLTSTEIFISDGTASQSFTMIYIPITSEVVEEITVDDIEWTRVTSLVGQSATATVYTFDYTTGVLVFGDGVNGKIPPLSSSIQVTYTPDLNTFGKSIYEYSWVSVRSNGVVPNGIPVGTVTPEESLKVDNNTIQVIHYPYITGVTGVWDNPSKTGTNYYTGGSYEGNIGRIYLGTPLTTDTPYTEYGYQIGDDAEGNYTQIGAGITKTFVNRIPKNNAKRLQLKVDVPETSSTESGSYLKAILRVLYAF